jgi:hypothetical protein
LIGTTEVTVDGTNSAEITTYVLVNNETGGKFVGNVAGTT